MCSKLLFITFLNFKFWVSPRRGTENYWLRHGLDPIDIGLSTDSTTLQRRQWHPTPVPCRENPMDGRAWWAAVHGVAKSWTRLSDFTFTFHFHALEKEMAAHSVSCLKNPRDGGAWWADVYGVTQGQTRLKQLSSSSSLFNVGGKREGVSPQAETSEVREKTQPVECELSAVWIVKPSPLSGHPCPHPKVGIKITTFKNRCES